jgi:hypothetical protein
LVIRGSGAPLLVIHSEFGVAGWLESFARLADHYDVVVPSLPGYGRSTRPDWIMSVHDLAEPQPDRVRVGYAFIAEALIQVSGRLISQGTADGGLIPQASISARASSDYVGRTEMSDSSAGGHYVDIVGVTGSIPVALTI